MRDCARNAAEENTGGRCLCVYGMFVCVVMVTVMVAVYVYQEVDEAEEDAEAEGVVHGPRAMQRFEGDGDARPRLFPRVVVGSHDFAQVTRERSQHEGNVECGDAWWH